jgi:hypothetical protein
MATDEWAHPVWEFFKFPKTARICKFKTDAFHYSKNTESLHDAIHEYSEQLSQLGQLQILNRIHSINFGTNLNLNFLWILKGFKPFWKNMRNSLKFTIDLIFTKVNLFGCTCMQEFWVITQISNDLVWIKEKSLNLKFKSHNIYNTNQIN